MIARIKLWLIAIGVAIISAYALFKAGGKAAKTELQIKGLTKAAKQASDSKHAMETIRSADDDDYLERVRESEQS